MKIQVVFAEPRLALVANLNLSPGLTVRDAVEEARKQKGFDSFKMDEDSCGIFGKKVGLDQPLRDGDRVEIYRLLTCDPKELRRRRQRKAAC